MTAFILWCAVQHYSFSHCRVPVLLHCDHIVYTNVFLFFLFFLFFSLSVSFSLFFFLCVKMFCAFSNGAWVSEKETCILQSLDGIFSRCWSWCKCHLTLFLCVDGLYCDCGSVSPTATVLRSVCDFPSRSVYLMKSGVHCSVHKCSRFSSSLDGLSP